MNPFTFMLSICLLIAVILFSHLDRKQHNAIKDLRDRISKLESK